MLAWIYVIILILQAVAVNSQSPAILRVANVIPGATATFACSLPSLTGSTPLDIDKDNVALYECTNIAFTCSKASLDSDYSDVTFTDLGTASAKGTFTVANADQTRDGGEWTCKYGTSLISSSVNFVVSAQSPATLSVTNVLQAATATFECSYPSLRSPTTLGIYKDGVALYTCTDIASTCSKSSTDIDYSDVTFTDLGTSSAKGTFTVANVDQTRDGGEWTCKYGTSLISSSVTFVVIAQSKATFSVTNVIQGATATFESSYPSLTSPTTFDIYKDGVALYTCTDIASTCSKSSTDIDYSDVTFTDLGTASAKGTFTVANVDQTRDGGDWTCKYGTSLISSSVTFVVIAQSPATFSVTNVIQGSTATFESSYPILTSPTTLDIYKDGVAVYTCTDIASTCSKSSTDIDYSDVTFTNLGTASAKGIFTVTNVDKTRDGGDWTCKYGTSLISSSVTFIVIAQSPATHSVTNVVQGETATFKCSYPSLTSPTTLDIYKDGVALYQCTNIASTCSKSSPDSDYSDVSFTGLGTESAKGTFTVANADHTRDGGEWKCEYGTSLLSSSVTFIVIETLYWCISNICSCIGLIVGVIIGVIIVGIVVAVRCWCYRHNIRGKTIEKVTHDTIQLRWRMVGLDPKGLGVKAICGEPPHNVDPNDKGTFGEPPQNVNPNAKGTYTVTFENLTPDTSITIYLEFTDKKRKHCREKLIQMQTLKASTSKPKGLLKTNRVHAAYAPRPGHDGEDTHNRTSSPDSNFTGIP